jgi:hypothetical protein
VVITCNRDFPPDVIAGSSGVLARPTLGDEDRILITRNHFGFGKRYVEFDSPDPRKTLVLVEIIRANDLLLYEYAMVCRFAWSHNSDTRSRTFRGYHSLWNPHSLVGRVTFRTQGP